MNNKKVTILLFLSYFKKRLSNGDIGAGCRREIKNIKKEESRPGGKS
jgi:hypothetical protein